VTSVRKNVICNGVLMVQIILSPSTNSLTKQRCKNNKQNRSFSAQNSLYDDEKARAELFSGFPFWTWRGTLSQKHVTFTHFSLIFLGSRHVNCGHEPKSHTQLSSNLSGILKSPLSTYWSPTNFDVTGDQDQGKNNVITWCTPSSVSTPVHLQSNAWK
jgi:hypothetical protein